ncbi:MAG: CdaR family protein [Desulfobacterales bacterium]
MRKLLAIVGVAILLVVACGYVLWAETAAIEREFFVPITATGLPSGMTLEGVLPQGIEIRVRGPLKTLESLGAQTPLTFPLDLSGLTPGEHTIDLDGQLLALPRRAEIERIDPQAVTLRVAREDCKRVPLQVSHTGIPAPGFYLSEAEIVPPTVEICGSTSRISKMDRVFTKPVDIEAATGDVTQKIPLELPLEVIYTGGPELVVATLCIQTRTVVRQFTQIPVEGRGADLNFTIHPAYIALEVKGPSDLIEKSDAARQIEAFVDLKGLAPGVYVRRASIRLPLEARLVGEVEPELFTVQIGANPKDTL